MKKILIAIIVLAALNAKAQNAEVDPAGILSYYLSFSMLGKANLFSSSEIKQNKIKGVIVTDEEKNVNILESYYDREGRAVKLFYGKEYAMYSDCGMEFGYTSKGGIDSLVLVKNDVRTVLKMYYGENYPEYMIINSPDMKKSLRYDIETASGKISKMVNENFKSGSLSYIFRYDKEDIYVSLGVNENKPVDAFYVKYSSDEIIFGNYIGTKIVFVFANDRIAKMTIYNKDEVVSESVYNGLNEIFTSKGITSKRKYTIIYYED